MAKVSTEGKTTEEKMALADEISRGYFRQGLNCAECVLRTFMDMHDTDLPESIIKMASGFGGGMGHTKNTCGAITGAVLALGTVKGRDPFEKEEMSDRVKQLTGEVYPLFGSMVNEMKEQYGSLICSELSDPFGDFAGKARKKNCMEMIAYCSSLAEKYADK
ncbi:MAG: C-GCAxxG-C-C family protein [Clostridia bacterium]|nr:C-GCAxxG-C-C family protein [Clostridia bacterium]